MEKSKKFLWAVGITNALLIVALVVLSIQLFDLRDTLNALRASLSATVAKLTSLEEKEKSDTDKNQSSVRAVRQDLDKAQTDFANMKADLAGSLGKSISKEIIDAATKQAVSKAVIELTSNNSSKLIDQLAKGMASNYRAELTGPPGKDANDERVATFLLAQPEFIDAVSVSVLQLQQSRNK